MLIIKRKTQVNCLLLTEEEFDTKMDRKEIIAEKEYIPVEKSTVSLFERTMMNALIPSIMNLF